jgi:hypothetical protein
VGGAKLLACCVLLLGKVKVTVTVEGYLPGLRITLGSCPVSLKMPS